MLGQLECDRPELGATGGALRMEDLAVLILSRKWLQQIVIDTPAGKVTVQVTRIAGNQVTLGIEAPKEVKILRGELVRDGRAA